MSKTAEWSILLQTADPPTDPVSADIEDQVFSGCFGIVLLFFIISGSVFLSLAYLLRQLV